MLLQRIRSCYRSSPWIVTGAPLSRAFTSIANAGSAENGSLVIPSASLPEVQVCGRGDKRTKKGKRFNHSNGNCRHQKGWEIRRLREKWEIPAGPAPGSLLPRPFPPLLSRY